MNGSNVGYEESAVGFFSGITNRVKDFFRKVFTAEEVCSSESEVEHLRKILSEHIAEKPTDFDEILQKALKPDVGLVIDASITSVKNIRAVLKRVCEETSFNIHLTSITIRELQRLQKMKDSDGLDARFILNHAIEKPYSYQLVKISEKEDTADNCILEYCETMKENVILLTSDKEMALNAKMCGVNVLFLKQTKTKHAATKQTSGIVSLYPVRKIGKQLFAADMQTAKRTMKITSADGKVYSQNICELHLGDNILIASLKDDCLIFVHYKLIALSTENNVQTIFTRRYYTTDEIDKLENEEYKTFLNEFIENHQINF